MFRVEDQKVRPSEVQYLFSPGFTPKKNKKDKGKTEEVVDNTSKPVEIGKSKTKEVKATTFFHPSITFPSPIQLISVSLLYTKPGKNDKTVHLCMEQGKINEPQPVDGYSLIHPAHKRASTVVFDKPYYIEPETPFYFSANEKLKGDTLTIAVKHVNICYGSLRL
jgi:hypothetical protein